MAKDITVNVKAIVDDSEVKGLEEEIENIDGNDPDVQVAVEDGEVLSADAVIEDLNQTAEVDIEVDDTLLYNYLGVKYIYTITINNKNKVVKETIGTTVLNSNPFSA